MKEEKYVQGRRLAWFRSDGFTWDNHWSTLIDAATLFPDKATDLGFLDFLLRYLPPAGRILEAGCGMGQVVYLLRNNGFECEGVDNASQTITAIQRLKPDLPVRVADLLHLDVSDDTYDGLVSLGVVEHRQEGPEPFLNESHRVLRKGGVAIFTVPFFSPLRRVKAMLGCYSSNIHVYCQSSERFYQYAFQKKEFCRLLRKSGFQIKAIHHYDVWKALKDEIPFFAWLNHHETAKRYRDVMNRQTWLLPLVAHMLSVVCLKLRN